MLVDMGVKCRNSQEQDAQLLRFKTQSSLSSIFNSENAQAPTWAGSPRRLLCCWACSPWQVLGCLLSSGWIPVGHLCCWSMQRSVLAMQGLALSIPRKPDSKTWLRDSNGEGIFRKSPSLSSCLHLGKGDTLKKPKGSVW